MDPRVFILVSVLLGVIGQLLLKNGASSINLSSSLFQIFVQFSNPSVFLGLLSYAVSVVFWILALSKLELSYAYPFLSLGYILVVVISVIFFKETFGPSKILAVLFIAIGLFLLARS